MVRCVLIQATEADGPSRSPSPPITAMTYEELGIVGVKAVGEEAVKEMVGVKTAPTNLTFRLTPQGELPCFVLVSEQLGRRSVNFLSRLLWSGQHLLSIGGFIAAG